MEFVAVSDMYTSQWLTDLLSFVIYLCYATPLCCQTNYFLYAIKQLLKKKSILSIFQLDLSVNGTPDKRNTLPGPLRFR